MKRLTVKTGNSYGIANEDGKASYKIYVGPELQGAINKLGRLEDKLENGTLVKLPVPIGTPVYILCREGAYLNTSRFRISDLPEWGKRVFKTPEDALRVSPDAVLCETLKAAGYGKEQK